MYESMHKIYTKYTKKNFRFQKNLLVGRFGLLHLKVVELGLLHVKLIQINGLLKKSLGVCVFFFFLNLSMQALYCWISQLSYNVK